MRTTAIVLLAALAAAGAVGGVAFLVDPSGHSLGLELEQLPVWWPGDYLGPGLGLLVVFGFGSLAAAVLLGIRHRLGWPAAVAIGIALVLWMGLQVASIGLVAAPMQLGFSALGLVLLVVATLGARRRLERSAG
ncbi:hypothetical protein [Homoserinibacter sp. YIM 151385]|uniref:hypothetical protein n=1 Tax=Homoserinibacter sp. YIM 151385 TaxID=2985506 RepID=UPI0022F0838C|nr:hypothetical protein [Homoserinibacter sp. YIM 151385]WBU38322.1 hypothetical protein OF852_01690 [Homoserinibacter sp. YIM 151385]